ncbi:response regulator [Methylogaea oryzae]|uniref:Response regulator n=2 Tax=Methylogaea oryzae TaxID=1295382 RepID=A0A8D4VMQ6_9GAMM|nr:response regulator [Methylogaea oryzae]BBL71033.1 hypothetical protein MoryE10_16390 [Methylogaea oryzae]
MYPQALRILVVDDNPLNRDLVRLQLEEFGFAVETVCNGEEALLALTASPYKLVLMDLHMPVLGGRETIRRLRATDGANRDVPVIALTAQTCGSDRETLKVEGFNGVLYKPLEMDELAQTLAVFYPEAMSAANQAAAAQPGTWPCLLRRANGSVALAQLLLTRLMEELPRQMALIMQALDSGQREKALESAHKLHGSAAYFDLNDIKAAADTLERLLIAQVKIGEQAACNRLAAAIDAFLLQRDAIMAEAALASAS